jgi:putative membrane protein
MLLIGPFDALRQFAIPAVVALVGISSSRGNFELVYLLPVMAVPAVLGFVPWLTTRYRITATQFQRRSGLVNKKQLTAPLDRVRSVDLEATVLHRLLGLTKVKIGTGVDDTRIELNALSLAQAEELRAFLLTRRAATLAADRADAGEAQPGALVSPVQAPEPAVLASIDWSWLKFAPFSLSRLAIVAGAFGVLAQFGENLPFLDADHLDAGLSWILGFALPLVIVSVLLTALVGWLVISVTGYIVQWWNMRLTREHGTLRLTAGLLTSHQTTVEEAKVRGVQLSEPLLLQAVHGAELSALATGIGSGGVTKVLPPCPLEVCHDVGQDLLDDASPLRDPLVPHGSAAHRRCHVRAQWATLLAVVLSTVPVVALGWSWWLPVGVACAFGLVGGVAAEAEYRHLGHLLTPHHLTSGSGALQRRRTVLERDGVIGWVIGQSYFQRRAGLATLTATTAAGNERVAVRDIPVPLAVALTAAVTPTAVRPFLRSAPG